MSDYDPLAAVAAQQTAPQQSAPTYDPLSMVAQGKTLPAANESNAQPPLQPDSWESQWMRHGNPVDQFVQGAFDRAITSTGGAIAGGLRGLWDIATGKSQAAAADVDRIAQESTYQPQTPAQSAGATVASSNWNPINWPGVALDKSGQFLGDTAERFGAPPIVSTALRVAPAAAASLWGLKGAGVKPGEGYVPEVERVAPESTGAPTGGEPAAAPDGPPVEGGLPKEAQAERAAILKRVGITQARKSAVEGNLKDAATDYQVNKTDEPAGNEATAQFEHERTALTDFTQQQITRVGGSIGTDEDALINRGQTIARPFDSLRAWFKQQQKSLYAEAQSRSDELAANGNPGAYTQLQGVDRLLKSPKFQNTLMAQGHGDFLRAVQAQLEDFRRTNPNGFTPAAAEEFRQWLNTTWSPEKSWAIGQIGSAVDNDVMPIAGDNLYARARAITQLKARTLENPDGISALFDSDPKTPINRSTPFEKIPDRIMALPAEQFSNLIQTLQEMPPELRPEADAALGEIRGQLLNRVLKAGTETRAGKGAQLWRGQEVSQTLARHAAKFRIAFQDDPVEQAALKDLNSAGQIIRTPEGYPGAHAQGVNLSRRGVGAALVKQVGRIGGTAAGSALGHPITAVAGEMGGSALGERAAAAIDERAALKNWRKRVVSLEESH